MFEPEAAAMFCYQSIFDELHMSSSEITSNYLVVNCEKTFIVLTAQKLTMTVKGEVLIDTIYQVHTDTCGSDRVNDEFEKMLVQLFQLTEEEIHEVKTKFNRYWEHLICKEFEDYKYRYDYRDPVMSINIHYKLLSYFEEKAGKDITQLIEECTHYQLDWDDEESSLVIPYNTLYSIFTAVISKIIMFIKFVLKRADCQHITKVLLAGDFVESNILFEEVKKETSPLIEVLRCREPRGAVLKGAVIYGRYHSIIKFTKYQPEGTPITYSYVLHMCKILYICDENRVCVCV